jgi:hypothetical protein
VGWPSLYGAANYVLFRAYEAASTLQRHDTRKLAIIVVDPQTWPALELQFTNGWIKWDQPAFLGTVEQNWNGFLQAQREHRYPNIDADLAKTILTLDAVWILRADDQFGFMFGVKHAFSSWEVK